MNAIRKLFTVSYSKRLSFALLLLTLIAAIFWSQSRFPGLNDKALMGGGIMLEDPLSFEATYQIDPSDPVWKRIFLTTINWIMTNLKGMTFGILFGAAFLAMLRYLPRRSFKGGFMNSLLGVCVNCAAPIARGLFAGGSRLETTLAAMIASPTFNVIVLTMLISLFPLYLVILKVGLSLFVILVAVPLICRIVPERDLQVQGEDVSSCIIEPISGTGASEGFARAIFGFARDYGHDLWFIVRTTVPLMLLAGALGAAIATLVPPNMIQALPFTLLTVIGIAILGTVLPVPIAFDIVLAASLLAGGAPVGFVMVLLFTLGIFSIYSYLIVAGSISGRAANYVSAVIIVLGIGSAYAAEAYKDWEIERTLKMLQGNLEISLVSSAHAAEGAKSPERIVETADGRISIYKTPFKRRSPKGQTHFTRREAWQRGIDRPNRFSMADTTIPFTQALGTVAAADIDNDGDADVVLSDNHGGISIFLNDGTGQFQRSGIDRADVNGLPIFNATPVDIDNDGWLDLFITTFRRGSFTLRNEKGSFEASSLVPVKNNPDSLSVLPVGFGDVDKDGDLDAVLGNFSGLPILFERGERERNRILFNENGDLSGTSFKETKGTPGETLSILLSDFNQNGHLDLIEANDFNEPDVFYVGDGKGEWKQITPSDSIIPISTHTTMSIKTADLNNDLRFEIYLSQIAGRVEGISDRLKLSRWKDYCSGIERPDDKAICQQNIDIKSWYPAGAFSMDLRRAKKCLELSAPRARECKAVILRDIAIRQGRPDLCKRITDENLRVRQICESFSATRVRSVEESGGRTPQSGSRRVFINQKTFPNDIPQYFGANILLVKQGDGSYEDRAVSSNLDIGGWSWDVKIYDFDNDGLQDVHVLNGDWLPRELTPSNIFMRNAGNMVFEDKTEAWGLVDFLIVSGSAAADFDGDGDIDEVAQVANGLIMSYWNNSQSGNAITFELRDFQANRFGIGTKLIIRYGEGATKRQIRELQLSGGFGSFDDPVLHFGLGEAASVSRVDIEWSNGGSTTLEGPFQAGAKYRIVRE